MFSNEVFAISTLYFDALFSSNTASATIDNNNKLIVIPPDDDSPTQLSLLLSSSSERPCSPQQRQNGHFLSFLKHQWCFFSTDNTSFALANNDAAHGVEETLHDGSMGMFSPMRQQDSFDGRGRPPPPPPCCGCEPECCCDVVDVDVCRIVDGVDVFAVGGGKRSVAVATAAADRAKAGKRAAAGGAAGATTIAARATMATFAVGCDLIRPFDTTISMAIDVGV